MGYYCNSEYRPVRSVLLSVPGAEIEDIKHPLRVLYRRNIAAALLRQEFAQLISAYKKLGIKIHYINRAKIKSTDPRYIYNLMFVRDLFFMTPQGALLSRMFFSLRRDEVRYAQRALEAFKVPVIGSIEAPGTFEGADALWVNEKLVLVGVGNRTNTKGFLQVKQILGKQGVRCVRVAAPKGVLHLLGALQLVDAGLAVVRKASVGATILAELKKNRIQAVAIPEHAEVSARYAMNFVTVAPRRIIMAAGCPRTKKIYEKSGIRIVAEVPSVQLSAGDGGFACATGILSRE